LLTGLPVNSFASLPVDAIAARRAKRDEVLELLVDNPKASRRGMFTGRGSWTARMKPAPCSPDGSGRRIDGQEIPSPKPADTSRGYSPRRKNENRQAAP